MTNNPAGANALDLNPSGATVQALGGSGTVNGNVVCASTALSCPGAPMRWARSP